MAEIQTNMYNTTAPAPMNALTTVGNMQEIKNSMMQNQLMQQELPILQQRQQQMLMDTQKQKGEMDAMGYMADPAYDLPTGGKNWNPMLSHAGMHKPLSVMALMKQRDYYMEQQAAGVYPQGTPNAGATRMAPRQEIIAASTGGGMNSHPVQQPTEQPQPAPQQHITSQDIPPPGQSEQGAPVNLVKPQVQAPAASGDPLANAHSLQTSMPTGYNENLANQRDYYNSAQTAADSAKTENAALSNVYNLSKSGAPTGQVLGSFYTYLAQHNIAPAGAQSDTEKLQLIKDHAAQIATAGGGSRSDQDLFAKQLANVNENDLPKVLQTMIPYLQGARDMKIAQAGYLHKQDPTASDPAKIASARTFLQTRSDPRVWELKRLQKSDPDAFKARISSLDPVEAHELAQHFKALSGVSALGE